MDKRSVVGKKDWLLILILILIAGSGLTFFLLRGKKDSSVRAYIYKGDECLTEVDLTQDGSFSLDDYPNIVFEVKNGAVRFASSDCPDNTCVHTGFISLGGQYAVCLPYGLSLRIESADEPDGVTGLVSGGQRL